MRLRRDDLLPGDVEKHFEVNPAQTRCSLLELDDGQCRWPLGPLAGVATLFCGSAVEPGRAYCGHHWQMACS
jgi:hypothetical protein